MKGFLLHGTLFLAFLSCAVAAVAAPIMPFNVHSTNHVFQKVRPAPFMVMLAHDH